MTIRVNMMILYFGLLEANDKIFVGVVSGNRPCVVNNRFRYLCKYFLPQSRACDRGRLINRFSYYFHSYGRASIVEMLSITMT